jgi:hypothetical protein
MNLPAAVVESQPWGLGPDGQDIYIYNTNGISIFVRRRYPG